MKLSYKIRLFLYFSFIFTIFTIGIVAFEKSRDKKLKTEALAEKLDAYIEVLNAGLLIGNGSVTQTLDTLIELFPPNIRFSLIDKDGNVLFDNSIEDLARLENHAQRPEVIDALKSGK